MHTVYPELVPTTLTDDPQSRQIPNVEACVELTSGFFVNKALHVRLLGRAAGPRWDGRTVDDSPKSDLRIRDDRICPEAGQAKELETLTTDAMVIQVLITL